MNSLHTTMGHDEERFSHPFQPESQADHPRTFAALRERYAALFEQSDDEMPQYPGRRCE